MKKPTKFWIVLWSILTQFTTGGSIWLLIEAIRSDDIGQIIFRSLFALFFFLIGIAIVIGEINTYIRRKEALRELSKLDELMGEVLESAKNLNKKPSHSLDIELKIDATKVKNQLKSILDTEIGSVANAVIDHLLSYNPKEIDHGVVRSKAFKSALVKRLGAK